jgi:hypothetical protein
MVFKLNINITEFIAQEAKKQPSERLTIRQV